MDFKGDILSGEFDSSANEFSVRQVKSLSTESTLNEEKFQQLLSYLKEHKDDQDGQIITLYDSIPIRLSHDEVEQLLKELEQIGSQFQ